MEKVTSQLPNIHSRSDFFRALVEARRLTETLAARHGWDEVTRVADDLEQIEIWTANGRRPTKKERVSVKIPDIFFRIQEDGGSAELDPWMRVVSEVWYYFFIWLEDDELATTNRRDIDLLRLSNAPDDPYVDAQTRAARIAPLVRTGIVELERIMREHGLWRAEPIEPARLRFARAFAADTMTYVEWLQFVFVPRIEQLLASNGPWPEKSQLAPQGSSVLPAISGRTPLITHLRRLDRIFETA